MGLNKIAPFVCKAGWLNAVKNAGYLNAGHENPTSFGRRGILAPDGEAVAAANKIGAVYVDTSGTACKVPDAITYIDKVKARGSLGKKKKTVKC
jgi:hypothetical protein